MSSRFPPEPPLGSGGDRARKPRRSFAGPNPPRTPPLLVPSVFGSGLPWPSPLGRTFDKSKSAILLTCRTPSRLFQPAVNGNFAKMPMAANLLAQNFAFPNKLVERRFGIFG